MKNSNIGHSSRLVFGLILGIILVGRTPCQELDPGPRTWTDNTGKHTVIATFVEIRDEKVRLKKEDGGTIDVPLEKLSDGDRRHRSRSLRRQGIRQLHRLHPRHRNQHQLRRAQQEHRGSSGPRRELESPPRPRRAPAAYKVQGEGFRSGLPAPIRGEPTPSPC